MTPKEDTETQKPTRKRVTRSICQKALQRASKAVDGPLTQERYVRWRASQGNPPDLPSRAGIGGVYDTWSEAIDDAGVQVEAYDYTRARHESERRGKEERENAITEAVANGTLTIRQATPEQLATWARERKERQKIKGRDFIPLANGRRHNCG